MTLSLAERHRLAIVGWLATVGTSIALFTAVEEKKYVLIGAGLSGLVVAIGMGLRQLHVPALVVPLVQLIVAVELLLLGYGHHTAYGVVPTGATVSHVQDVLSSGIDVAQRYAAPTPPSAGLMLILVAFITLVAILVDVIAAGLARAPLAGLPLLALYSVPVASLPDGVPAVGFIPGAVGYLALLMLSERERLAHWGRHVARSTQRGQSEVVDTSGLASTGRRISLVAVTTAVVLPILLPTFTSSMFTGGNGFGNGKGNVNFTDPMVSLSSALHRHDAVDLMQITSENEPTYLRLAVLDQPGPSAWRNSGTDLDSTVPAEGALPAPAGMSASVATTRSSMTINLLKDFPVDNAVWLPVPNDLTSLSLFGFPGEFGFVPGDSTITSRGSDGLSHVTGYLANYVIPDPTAAQLEGAGPPPAAIVNRYDSIPDGVPQVVRDDAIAVTARYHSDYERALALQSFFRDNDNFQYTLDAGYGDGYRAMALFLQKRKGYCQHFAATMAMMAREIGIPSRVVVGFLQPKPDLLQGDYVFDTKSAHAWPELYFGGVGWVRFEPTPGNGATIPGYTHPVTVGQITKPTTPTTSAGGPNVGGHTTGETTSAAATDLPGNNAGGGSGGGTGLPSAWWLLALIVVALALTPGSIRWGVRRSRLARAIDGGTSSEYAWLELRDRILDLRLPWTGSVTPRARSRFVEPLLGGDPDGVAALDRLSLTVERSRYASTPLAGAQPAEDARQIMAAITDGVDAKSRILAFLWPASLMPELRLSWSRLKRQLVRRPQPSS